MKIGNFETENNLFLAPMAGITDLAFRTVCREQGAGLLYTEMISAKALCYQDKKTKELLKTNESDTPLCVQIFGSEQDIVAEGGKRIEEMGFSMLDLNAGCPAPKITKNGEGSALMKSPCLLGQIVEKLVKSVSIPVSVKIRAGFDGECVNAAECAKIAENSGACAVTVHGRTREQFYSGTADLEIIRKVKESVSVPVTGNGDITDSASARRMLEQTDCDAIMIGRAALGNPFVFAEIEAGLMGVPYSAPSISEKMEVMLRQMERMLQYKGEHLAVLEARKHLGWYLKGIRNSKRLKERANQVKSLKDMKEIIKMVFEQTEEKKSERD